MMSNNPSMMPNSDSESDCSESNSSNSSDTTSSSDNSGQDVNELFETAKILSERLNLPKDLCESRAIFNEFFSLDTWNCLPEPVQNHLKANFLPNFEENNDLQKDITIEQLFTGQLERFDKRPLEVFQHKLEEGNFRPDIAKLRSVVVKAQRHEQRFQECERISRMAKMMVISREKLLRAVNDAPPGSSLRPERIMAATPKLSTSGAAQRAKKRYFQEINAIAEEVGLPRSMSDDENYPEGPPAQLSRKQKRHLSGIQMGASSPGAERRIYCTLNPKGSSLDHLVGPGGTAPLSEEFYRQILHRHKKRKLEEYDHPELDTSEVQLKDIFERTKLVLSGVRRTLPSGKNQNIETNHKPPAQSTTPMTKPTAAANRFQQQLNRSQSLLMLGQQTASTSSSVASKSQPELLTVATKSNLNFTSDTDDEDFDDLLDEDGAVQQMQQQYAQQYGFEEDDDYEDEIQSFNPKQQRPPLQQPTNKLQPKVAQTKVHTITSGKKILPPYKKPIAGKVLPKVTTNNKVQPSVHHSMQENITIAHDPTGMFEDRLATTSNHNLAPSSLSMNYTGKVKAATLSDLEGIDMMHLPVDLDDGSNINILEDLRATPTIGSHQDSKLLPSELMAHQQDTHVCFLSLIRDCFCATPDHRMPLDELRRKVSMWMSNPITALNNWYNHAENWLALLISAINFLSGEFLDQPEDFVPYIEFKTQLNTYQWIGAGRDSDNHLLPLYQFWLTRRNEMGVRPSSSGSSTTPSKQKHENKHYNKQYNYNHLHNSNSSLTDEDYGQPERVISPPPPRSTTTWIVRKASNEDIREFRRQEKRRYENPHMSYTYQQHGYESVVGPVKGIYTQVPGISKARDHNMLVPERPNYVTILTLVRDATARLPNGEGTRVEICELLKSSQYISQTAHDQLQTIVSGALDRMHTEHDPCVKYDAKKKIWIYLHRNRSEEEFERLHHQFQGVAKPKTPKSRTKGHKHHQQQSQQQSPPPGKLLQSPHKTNSTIKFVGNKSDLIAVSKASHNNSSSPSKLNSSSNSSAPSTPSPTPTHLLPIKHISPSTSVQSQLHSPVMLNKSTAQMAGQKSLIKTKIIKTVVPAVATALPPIVTNENAMEYIDVEASLDIHTTPILVKSAPPQPQSVLINEPSDTTSRTSSPVVIKNVSLLSQGDANKVKKLTTHIHPQQQQQQPKTNMTSILVSHQQNQRSQSPIVTKTGPLQTTGVNIKKISRSLILNSATTLHTLPTTTAVTTTKIIPSATNQIKVTKTSQSPIPVAKNSLLQTKQIIRVNNSQGKSLINPSIVMSSASPSIISNIQTQGMSGVTNTGSATVQIKSLPSSGSRTNIISTITIPKGQQAFTSAQQKQILQTIMASQQQKQKGGVLQTNPHIQQGTGNSPRVIFTQQMNANQQNSTNQQQQFIQQKLPALSVAASSGFTTSSGANIIVSSIAGSTSTATTASSGGSPQIMQIQPQGISPKVHTVTATNLTPQQQQQLLQTIKQQQVKNQTGSLQQQQPQQQQSLIVKQPFIQFQRTNANSTKTSPMLSAQMINKQPISIIQSSSNQNQTSMGNQTLITTAAPTLTRVLKPGTSLIQHQQQNQIIASTSNSTIKTGTTTMTKMLTNSGGQLISLETLLQQKGIAPGTTLRVAGSKPGQTQLIQIAGGNSGNPGQPAQYAVVSQGRNLISQRLLTTQAGGQATLVKNSEIKTSHTGTITTASPTMDQQTSQSQQQQQFKIIHAPNQQHSLQQHQLQQLSSSEMMNTTKFVGVQNMIGGKMKTTGIRMVNASNLNIAHIGGKPVIIASKNSVGGMTQIAGNQNIMLQSSGGAGSSSGTNFMIGGQTVKLQGNMLSTANLNLINQQQQQHHQPQTQTVMLGNQLVKVQTINQIQSTMQQQQNQQPQHRQQQNSQQQQNNVGGGTMMIGNTGQTIKVHHPQVSLANSGQQVLVGNQQIKNPVKTNTTIQQSMQQQPQQQRVMLATQGQGGQLVTQQILLPPGFQGGSINIKTLQGLKVIPITQQTKTGNNSDRPVYARILTAPQQPKPINQQNTPQNNSNE